MPESVIQEVDENTAAVNEGEESEHENGSDEDEDDEIIVD